MKWAPNKKLHFEVAVIKAIQTLSQVTLTEVIENLTALREWRRNSGPLCPAAEPPLWSRSPRRKRNSRPRPLPQSLVPANRRSTRYRIAAPSRRAR